MHKHTHINTRTEKERDRDQNVSLIGRGHNFKLPISRYAFTRRRFIKRCIFCYVHVISIKPAYNVVCLTEILNVTYLLTNMPMIGIAPTY